MTAAHLILVWEERTIRTCFGMLLGRGTSGGIRGSSATGPTTGPSASYYAWIAAGRPVHGVRAQLHGDRSGDDSGQGIRCERCMARLGHVLEGPGGLESANATLMGEVTLVYDDERSPATS